MSRMVGSGDRAGVGVALATALLFAASVNIVPFAYAAGASVLLLMVIRFVFTAVVSSSLSRTGWRNRNLKRSDIWLLLAAGVCLAGQSFGYIASVEFLPVSVAVILFYTFPILTYLFNSMVDGRSFRVGPFIALGFALLGIYFLVQTGAESWQMIGVFLALFAAVMQGFVNILSSKIKVVSGWDMVKYTSLLPAALFVGAFVVDGGGMTGTAVVWGLGAAVVFCLGLYLFYRSIAMIGSVRTANLLYFEPVFTLMLSLIIFGERLALVQWLGIGVIFLATSALEIQEQRVAR